MFLTAAVTLTAFGCDAPDDTERSADIADDCEPYAPAVDDLPAADGPERNRPQADATEGPVAYACQPEDFEAYLDAIGSDTDLFRVYNAGGWNGSFQFCVFKDPMYSYIEYCDHVPEPSGPSKYTATETRPQGRLVAPTPPCQENVGRSRAEIY